MKYLLELYAKLSKEKDIEAAHKVVHEAVRFHTKQGLFSLGTSANPPSLVIVKNRFRNVPADPRILGPWAVSGPATSYTETFFFAPEGWQPAPSAALPNMKQTALLPHLSTSSPELVREEGAARKRILPASAAFPREKKSASLSIKTRLGLEARQ